MQCFWQYRDHNGVRCRARLVLPAHNTIHHVKLRPELGISPQRWSFPVSVWKALPRLECLVWLLDCVVLLLCLPDLICCKAHMHCGQGCMECSMSGPLIRDSASAFPLVDPFLYMISKLNTCIARAQRHRRPSIFCSPSHLRGRGLSLVGRCVPKDSGGTASWLYCLRFGVSVQLACLILL